MRAKVKIGRLEWSYRRERLLLEFEIYRVITHWLRHCQFYMVPYDKQTKMMCSYDSDILKVEVTATSNLDQSSSSMQLMRYYNKHDSRGKVSSWSSYENDL